MQQRTNTEQARGSEAPQPGDEPQRNGNGAELHPDQELVYRIKNAIDSRGRYSFRLSDMSAGFAAAQGISNAAARRAIEDRFNQHVGQTPQEYLDRHYDERRELNQDSTRSRSHQRENGQARGR